MAQNYIQMMAGRLGQGMGIDPRRRMAQQLAVQGVDTSPAYFGTGLGRLGKALAAAYMMRQSMGQETDAFKAMMEQEKDTFRQPTEAEFGEAYPAAFPGMQRSTIDNQPQVDYTGPQEFTPPDSALMGMGELPGRQDKIDRDTNATGTNRKTRLLAIASRLQGRRNQTYRARQNATDGTDDAESPEHGRHGEQSFCATDADATDDV